MTTPDALTPAEFWATTAANHIGMTPPTTDHAHWLEVHLDMAEACMTRVEYALMIEQTGATDG